MQQEYDSLDDETDPGSVAVLRKDPLLEQSGKTRAEKTLRRTDRSKTRNGLNAPEDDCFNREDWEKNRC